MPFSDPLVFSCTAYVLAAVPLVENVQPVTVSESTIAPGERMPLQLELL
jgi:hypothetical protein